MEEIIEFMGITFHLSPGQRACFKYEDGTYTGYASNRTKLDTFFQILTDIEADKRRRQWEAIPPNIRKLAEQIHKRRNPEKNNRRHLWNDPDWGHIRGEWRAKE